ncbi:TadE/TadG family type IV pilus assembly protein [Paraeggerthella hongkongensis]|uniref:Pilus assembly protein TadE n=1 Tax=Paraeggerthella hongkongensis TaxID=230658 RepID=A0A3N0BKR3_9ACTN|nr:TadE/TadG family type IV pilus assembly protein [Paraeggerthella hongkongensis]RNL48995.1 pilus assembly protein TadE [Paraeggerthella hongkongensis]
MAREAATALRAREPIGQATVEAAVSIPVLLVGLLLLMQPAIVLYDRMIMHAAASEACRLLATKTDAAGPMDESCEAFVRHRLGAVPPVACFHVHEGGCSWDVVFEGDERSDTVSVTVSNELRPLPLLDAGAALLGLVNERGNLEVQVSCRQPAQPDWASRMEAGRSPRDWIGAWLQ